MKLIDKDALVAEIESRINELSQLEKASYEVGLFDAYKIILSFLDTLEAKEVDLDKVIDGLTAGWIEGEEYGELQNVNTFRCVTLGEVKEAMRCMFELGIKAAQKGE